MGPRATVSQEDTGQTSRGEGAPLVSFLEDVMRRRKRLPSQMAKDIDVSHPTVGRWLSGEDIPSTLSCRKLAAFSGVNRVCHKLQSILGWLCHLS